MSKGNKLDTDMENKLSLGEGQSVLACLRLRPGRDGHGTLLCTESYVQDGADRAPPSAH